MCRLGVFKNDFEHTLVMGRSFFDLSSVYFDDYNKKIGFTGYDDVEFWKSFDYELAITGLICVVLLVIVIIIFAIKRHRRLEKRD
jgi:hypothetical protein